MTETSHTWGLIQDWLDAQPWHISQAQLAKKIGVSTSLVTDWKYGRSVPNPENLRELAAVIEVSPERLIDAMLKDEGYRAPAENDQVPRAKRSAG